MGVFDGIFKGGIAGVGEAVKSVVSSFKLDPTVDAQLNEKLQEVVMQHQEKMQQLAEQEYEAQLKDIQDARNREIQLNQSANASWLSKNVLSILALFVSTIWGSLTVYLFLRMLDFIQANPNVKMDVVLGVYAGLTGTMGIIMNYYFGTSHSAVEKDKTIATIAKS